MIHQVNSCLLIDPDRQKLADMVDLRVVNLIDALEYADIINGVKLGHLAPLIRQRINEMYQQLVLDVLPF